ncbi:reverse transcriptase domain-containing protein [Tanacetum coccineum]
MKKRRLSTQEKGCSVIRGRNMELNADKMVIKIDSEKEMLADIKETLERIRVINLKINPKKCSFGVEEERFSGHLITKQGIKADPSKILADFLAETPPKKDREIKDGEAKRKELEPENAWKIFTDGASSSDGSMVGLMLVNLEGKEYTYALRFEFETINNEAEYEALLLGLHIAKEMKIQELIIFVDSQLIANQVNKLFEARQPEVLVEVLQEKSITQKEVANITREKEDNWMISIWEFLLLGKLPDDPQKARKLRIKAPLYKLMDGTLYRRSYLSPRLRCVGAAQTKNIIQDVHQGSCEMHARSRSVVSKTIRLGYYWPSMHKDAKELIQKCKTCQIHSPVPRIPKQEMTSITSAWPFSQWGIDIVGPLPMAPGGARLGKTYQGWVDELPQVLWVHRTTPKSSNRETPFSLVYGSEVVIPIELGMETRKIQDFDPKKNKKRHREDLDILKERREIASIKESYYKQKLEKYYNKRVRPSTFKPGTYVLRLNSASKAEFQGKIRPKWKAPT